MNKPLVPPSMVLIVDETGTVRVWSAYAPQVRKVVEHLGPPSWEESGADPEALARAVSRLQAVVDYRITRSIQTRVEPRHDF